MKYIRSKSSGSVLLMVLMFVLIFLVLALITIKLVVMQSSTDELEITKARLFYAADGAVEQALHNVILFSALSLNKDIPTADSPVTNAPWSSVRESVSFYYTSTSGILHGSPETRYVYYINDHPSHRIGNSLNAQHWVIYDSETLPPIATQVILREETYQNLSPYPGFPIDTWNFRQADGYLYNTGAIEYQTPYRNDAGRIYPVPNPLVATEDIVERRYYVITAKASLYNPLDNSLYGDENTQSVHILVERKGNNASAFSDSNPGGYRFNYVFRSRKNL